MEPGLVYARITLQDGSRYILPLSELNILIDEICEAAAAEDLSAHWRISLVVMTQEEYHALPEFDGH